jgi:hypothetical protein
VDFVRYQIGSRIPEGLGDGEVGDQARAANQEESDRKE